MKCSRCLLPLVVLLAARCALAAGLPQDHECQKTLRAHMATLTAKDFEHGVTTKMTVVAPSADKEVLFRNYIQSLMLAPIIGSKRGAPSVNVPARLFTLAEIEGPKSVMLPPCWADSLMSFVQWNYPGNPYYNNRGLKMRCFVTGAINLMMIDDYLTKNPAQGRADWYSYRLVYWGFGYPGFKDLLPPKVRKAYATGLRRFAERVMKWGVRGEEPHLDMIAAVGLWYAARAVDDPRFTAKVEAYARMLYTDPKYFHPAGYFVERGGIDTGFGGMANLFAIWGALAADWDFAKETVARIYRLRAHLDLPEPDGARTGPSAFNARLGSAPFNDQWHNEGARDFGAAMITDEAAYIHPMPSPDVLAAGAAKRASWCAFMISQNPVKARKPGTGYIYWANEELKSREWSTRMWHTYNFPLSLNAAYEHYKKGAYAHYMALEKANSPMLKSPFLRGETFLRDFAKAFFVTRHPSYAAILHTGPVARQRPDDGLYQYVGPMGFGGGQLSAFWTPQAGTVLQARRMGQKWETVHDKLEEWRDLPIHAVSGVTADGKTFTSGRIADPVVTSEIKGAKGTVTVSGMISTDPLADTQAVKGTIEYSRRFEIAADGVRVETTVKPPGNVKIAELYEILPVFHREGGEQGADVVSKIEFLVGGKWIAPTVEPQANVAAIRISRFKGVVEIKFDKPQTAKLSPKEWADNYLSRGVCRNVLLDLAAAGNTVSYRIAAVR